MFLVWVSLVLVCGWGSGPSCTPNRASVLRGRVVRDSRAKRCALSWGIHCKAAGITRLASARAAGARDEVRVELEVRGGEAHLPCGALREGAAPAVAEPEPAPSDAEEHDAGHEEVHGEDARLGHI